MRHKKRKKKKQRPYKINHGVFRKLLTLILLACWLPSAAYWVGGSAGCGGAGGGGSASVNASQEKVVYYLDDHLGNANLLVDSNGNVLREEERYPYGLDRRADNPGGVQPDYAYTGKEVDEDTGLVYFGGRYYVPELGRWASPDPLFINEPKSLLSRAQEGNLYSYVRGNPISNTDPNGLGTVAQVDKYDITSGVPDSWYPYGGGLVDLPVRGINTAINVMGYSRDGINRLLGYAGTSLSDVMDELTPIFMVAPAGAVSLRAAAAVSELRLLKSVEPIIGKLAWKLGTDIEMGSVTKAEMESLKNVATKYDTTLTLYGSRAAGKGRNIYTDWPVSKGPGTRSDIDILIDGEVEIQRGWGLADDLMNIGGGNLVEVRRLVEGRNYGPTKVISPDK